MDSNHCMIGDAFQIKLLVNVPSDSRIQLEAIDSLIQSTIEEVDILKSEPIIKTKGNENDSYTKMIEFVVWEPGKYSIPAINCAVDSDKSYTISAESFLLDVMAPGITGDSTYIADIKQIIPESSNLMDKIALLLRHPIFWLFFAMALVGLAYWFWKKRKIETPKPQSPEQIFETAIQRMHLLAKQDAFIDLHQLISFAIRKYTAQRLGIKALELPTSHFISNVSKHYWINEALFEEYALVLHHADLIKYAKASPLGNANEKAIQFCEQLLHYVKDKYEGSQNSIS